MSKPWSEVAASPQFQALPPDQQEQARSQYFDTVVAPQVPQADIETVRTQFNTATKPKAAPVPTAGKSTSGWDIANMLAQGDTEGINSKPTDLKTLGETANAIPQGVNTSVTDLAGLPMDAATNTSNLLKAGAGYVASKFSSDGTVPHILEADDPKNVFGTSEYIKNRIRGAGAGSLIDPADDNPGAQALHAGSELVGVAPIAGVAGEMANSNKLAAAQDLAKLGGVDGSAGATRAGDATPLELMRSAGYKVRPTDVQVANPADASLKPSLLDRAAQSAAGVKDLAHDFRLHNQQLTTKLIGEDMGLQNVKKIGPDELRRAKSVPGKTYDEVGKAVGDFNPSPSLTTDLQGLLERDDLSDTADRAARELLGTIQSGKPMNGTQLMAKISDLRERTGGGKVANAIEDEIGRQLEGSGQTLEDYQNARTQFAKIYGAQRALTTGGQIDAMKYKRIQEKYPDLLTGNARIVGIAAQEAPGVMASPKAQSTQHNAIEWLSDLAHTVTGARYVGRKIVGSQGFQNQYGAVANPTEASYFQDLGKRQPQTPDFQPPAPPAPQIGYQPGAAPVSGGAEVDAGAPRPPANNPAELQQVLEQAAAAAKANPAPAPQPQVAPGGLPALPAPGQLGPRGAQATPINVTDNGDALFGQGPYPLPEQPSAVENNPALARRATMSSMLAKQDRGLQPSIGRQTQDIQQRWLDQELKERGADKMTAKQRQALIVELLRKP
jgi:hypothetical protein